MTTDTTVKYINESMRSAPVLKRGAGTLIGLLDTFLVNGWGMATASSASISAGVCTINMPVGSEFEAGAVVLVAGATPASVNGEHRLVSGGTALTFASPEPDGAVTGTVTVKYAGCGWQKAYSGTNLAVYRSQNVAGARRYLRVNDSNADYARVVAYNSMTGVSTGTGPFPTNAQVSGGGYWHKTDGSTAADQRYDCVGDDMLFVYAPALYYAATGGVDDANAASMPWVFGEPVTRDPAGDVYATTIGVSTQVYWGTYEGQAGFPSAPGIYCERAHGGAGGAVQTKLRAESGTAATSGADTMFGSFPDGILDALYVARMCLDAGVSDGAMRAHLPGVWHIPQTGLVSHPTLKSRDTMPGPGALFARRFMLLWLGPGTKSGAILVDTDGPWR